MTPRGPDVEALKDLTRLAWLIHFESVATVGNDEDALVETEQ